MDNISDCDKNITEEFVFGIHEFVKFACEEDENDIRRGKIRCPCGCTNEETMAEDPNLEAQRFFEMLSAAQSPLWDGCDNYSMLLASLTALSLKTNYGLFKGCFNGLVKFMGDAMPPSNCMPRNLYQAKTSVTELGLVVCTNLVGMM
ncbi:hypothetical protein SESBI_06735 [Sesbania bispinosa]|nr:hypothetical protein SESBI_06735 [Sesbania bispinosa]